MPTLSCQLSFCTALTVLTALNQPQTAFNFEADRPGQLPSAWMSAKTGEGAGSDWRIVAYEANGQPNHALAQTSTEGPNALFNLCVRPDSKYADVDLSVKLKAVGGVHDQGGGLVWRYHDAKNYYITRWNPLEGNFRVYHVVDGKRTQLANADIKLPPDQWHTVRAVQRANRIQCYLDNSLLLDVTDDTMPAPGAIGLWSKADAVTWFDDLSVTSLDKK